MTHGNVTASVGTCHVCGRVDVDLTDRGVCVDEFACYDAWRATQGTGG